MKKMIAFMMVAAFGMQLMAQDSKTEPFMVKTLKGESVKNIESETSGGNITVTGVPASEARVEVFVRPSNGKDNQLTKAEIQKRLDEDYELTVSVSGGKLTAIAKSKKRNWDWKRALSISFHVYTDRNVSTDLTTSGGNIHLTDLAGTQKFTTSGGNLVIDKLKGKAVGRTSGGNINVTNSDDNLDLTTSGGNVTAENCKGNISLVTSGGSVRITGLSGQIEAVTSGGNVKGSEIKGELEAHTSGGNVDLRDLSCSVEASTSGGSIDVTMKELGSYVKLSNSGGNIDLQLPVSKGVDLKLNASKIKTDKLSNFSGSVEDDEINGKLNGGGVPVTVRAGSGRIYLSLK